MRILLRKRIGKKYLKNKGNIGQLVKETRHCQKHSRYIKYSNDLSDRINKEKNVKKWRLNDKDRQKKIQYKNIIVLKSKHKTKTMQQNKHFKM